jgi:hypothetical protein
MPDTDDLIDQLTDELAPTRSVSPTLGRVVLAIVALVTLSVVVRMFGMRPDFAAGNPHPVPLIGALVVLSAGIAIAAALTAMARPAVGAVRTAWPWAIGALAVLPAAALVTAVGSPDQRAAMTPHAGAFCFVSGSIASIASIVLLTLWLRRGAPTSPERASWLIGIASGAVGAFAIAFICPADAVTHIGTWHMGIIAVAAIASRLILPRFLKW